MALQSPREPTRVLCGRFRFRSLFFGELMRDIFAALIIAAALTVCALAYFDVLIK